MIHIRADLAFNVERARLEQFVAGSGRTLAQVLQQASLHIQCEGQHGVYQYQLYAATNANGPDPNLYNMVPDLDIQAKIARGFDSESISLVLRASGEVKGGRNALVGDPAFDYINLAGEADFDQEFGHRRAWVQFSTANGEAHTSDPIWQEMHDTGHAIARAMANGGSLQYKGDFTLPAFSRQQGVGTTFHDSGTLWMGDDPDTSVTDANGHFHHVTNVYCADQALFTTVGSANPVLTGLTLARKVAGDIVARHGIYTALTGEVAGFESISLDASNGWLTAPYNGTVPAGPGIVEMKPVFQGPGKQSIGIYYLPRVFGDVELYVEWKAFRTPDYPNSGVLLRMSDPRGLDFNNQTTFDKFYEEAVEIQIDDLGKEFVQDRNPQAIFGNSRYKTGAIYGIAQAGQWAGTVPAPDGDATAGSYWNVYQIRAQGNQISVRLNGKPVSNGQMPPAKNATGFIGFQFHIGRIQFRNLQINPL
jgi:hypothetical protein